MNANVLKTIYRFNDEAGLLEAGYSDERECAFPIEEALEGFNLEYIDTGYQDGPKELSRAIMRHAMLTLLESISDVDRMDKHLDTIVFAFGSLFKLGLTPQQAIRGLEVVMAANMKKLSAGKDEHGKQKKPKDWEQHAPEVLLQKILDERI